MFAQYVQHLKDLVHASAVGTIPQLDWFVGNIIDFLTSPFTGIRTRSYWPELLAALIIAGLVFVLRDRRAGQGVRDFFRFCFPSAQWRHRSTWLDVQIIVLNNFFAHSFNLTWRLNAALFTSMLVGTLTWAFGPSPHLLAWSTSTIVLYTIILGLADDFGYYIFHVASHYIPWLWAFHKVHHSAETLTVLANPRAHPMEFFFTGPCQALTTSLVLAPALYLGTGPVAPVNILGMNLVALFFCVIGTQLHHSHIWLSWGRTLEHVFISPAQHQIHHSTARRHWNRNMGGCFALWDWMFGTLYVPNGREELTFGLGSESQPYANGLAAYVLPFWEIMPWREAIRAQALRLLNRPAAAAPAVHSMAARPPP
jgi:sterol desaturase/sphingolipid hydroxylase (fatty acid hydroxylase superfamily)